MSNKLKVDPFMMFDLEPKFDIDTTLLEQRLLEQLAMIHPDKAVTATNADIQLATEQSAILNAAYQILIFPLKRAEYLLSTQGVDIENIDANVNQQLLLSAIEWREELQEAKDIEACTKVLHFVCGKIAELESTMSKAFASGNTVASLDTYLELKFLSRFKTEVEDKIEVMHGVI